MSQSQYIGRKYDVMAYQGVKPTGKVLLNPAFVDDTSPGGTICTGIQKLLQQFLILLLTETGTKPYDTEAGTPFMTQLRSGELRTELDVMTAFSMAVGSIATQLTSDSADIPDDEYFADASVEELTLQPGAIAIKIAVISRAGDARVAILPLSVVAG